MNFNEIFRKNTTYDNDINHQKLGLHPVSRKYNFVKTTGVSIWPPSLFTVEVIGFYSVNYCCASWISFIKNGFNPLVPGVH